MEIVLLVLVLLLVQGVPVAVAVVPPVLMAVRRCWSPAAVALWVLALGLLVASMAAVSADMDRVDATGGTGSILVGAGWLAGAALAATGSVVTVRRRTRAPVSPVG